jgi:medium-chain acyl-[acyl-carrier-protein] hydrolase
MLRLFQDASIEHTEYLGYKKEKTLERGFLWVIARTSVSISRLPDYDETIRIVTWPGSMMRILYPRFYAIEDLSGNTLVTSASIWTLIDKNKRTPVRPSESNVIINGSDTRDALPLPHDFKTQCELRCTTRHSRYSDLDLNGHVNNIRYLEWADDLLSPQYHKDHPLRSMKINYLSEIKPDTDVTMNYGIENDTLFICGSTDGTEAFKIEEKY